MAKPTPELVPVSVAIEALGRYGGVKRRMEVRGCVDGVTVYDDFAHHPTAIAATIDALRAKVGTTSEIWRAGCWKRSHATSRLWNFRHDCLWRCASLRFCCWGNKSGACLVLFKIAILVCFSVFLVPAYREQSIIDRQTSRFA